MNLPALYPRYWITAGTLLGTGIAIVLVTSATTAQQPPPFVPSPMVNFLAVNVGSAWLTAGSETTIFSNNIWPPGHANYASQPNLLPVPTPSPAVFWGVVFSPAAYTVRNTTQQPIDIWWNVYSDNSYVYQGRETIPALSYRAIDFPTMQMGYIYGPNPPGSIGPGNVGPLQSGGAGMSLIVRIHATQAGLIGYWDTQGSTSYPPGNYSRVSGASVTLTPLCRTASCT